ncbi:MAG: hypothetical protein AAF226_04095 [Verrucomicrobiota bacterium]
MRVVLAIFVFLGLGSLEAEPHFHITVINGEDSAYSGLVIKGGADDRFTMRYVEDSPLGVQKIQLDDEFQGLDTKLEYELNLQRLRIEILKLESKIDQHEKDIEELKRAIQKLEQAQEK